MRISFHGGLCCGIKTINQLGSSPKGIVLTKSETEKYFIGNDRRGKDVSSDMDFFWVSRPREIAGDRFDAILEHLKKYRPYGLVEVVLVTQRGGAAYLDMECVEKGYETFIEAFEEEGYVEDESDGFQDDWEPFIESRGFKLVTTAPNINSGNFIRVYHLVMNGGN